MAKPKAQTLQQRFGFMDKDLTTPMHDEIMVWLDQNMKDVILLDVYPPDIDAEIQIIKKTWEYPVTSNNKFIVGFLDMVVSYAGTQHPEYPLQGYYSDDGKPIYRIGFEVKAVIPSLGELFRQLRMYQTYIDFPLIVVSPDDRFEYQIQDQRIRFIRCPSFSKNVPFS